MKTSFGISRSLLFADLGAFAFLLVFAYTTYAYFHEELDSTLALTIFAATVLAISAVSVVRFFFFLSYRIRIEGGDLVESGYGRSPKRVDIASIKSVSRRTYRYADVAMPQRSESKSMRRVVDVILNQHMVKSDGPYFPGAGLPRFPVDPAIVEALMHVSPSIQVDKDLAPLLPGRLRKKLSMRLSAADTTFPLLWKAFLLILALLVLLVTAGVIFKTGQVLLGIGNI
jgi:hypothetical protein